MDVNSDRAADLCDLSGGVVVVGEIWRQCNYCTSTVVRSRGGTVGSVEYGVWSD